MAVEVRGGSYRVRIFRGKEIVAAKSFSSLEAARRWEETEKAKLTLGGQREALIRDWTAPPETQEQARELGTIAVPATFGRLLWRGWVRRADGITYREPGPWDDASQIEPEEAQEKASPLTLREIIQRHIDKLPPQKKGKKKSATRYALEAFLSPTSGAGTRLEPLIKKLAAKLRRRDFQKYRDQRLKEVKRATVVRELGRLHAMVETAREEWGLDITENPAAIRHPKGADEKRDRRLDKETDEEAKLLTVMPLHLKKGEDPDLLRDATIIAIDTAMRQGEILALRPSHLKPDHLRLIKDMTKTKNPRNVPLFTARVREVLARREAAVTGNALLFDIDPDTFKMRWSRAVRGTKQKDGTYKGGLGIKDLRFHDLRHEGTSRIFEMKKFTDTEIMGITGHESIEMLKRYHKPDAAELASRVFVEENEG